jgi:large subunit ribosomal protein L25
MTEHVTITLLPRTGDGSGAARRLRRQGLAPGIVYAHGDTLEVAVDAHAFVHAVPPEHFGSAMVRLVLDGRDQGTALVKSVQFNPLTRQVLNIEFQRVVMDDRVQVSIPVVLRGEAEDQRRGGVVEQFARSVTLKCRVSDVPEAITFDISAMEIGDAVRAGQLALPMACELVSSSDEVIVSLAPPTVPVGEEPMTIPEGVTGPELTGDKQKDDSQLAA